MIERAVLGASETQPADGWPAPPSNDQAAEIFGAMLAAFTALDASVTPVVDGGSPGGDAAEEGEGDGSIAAALEPVTLAPALSALLAQDIPLQQDAPTSAVKNPQDAAPQETQQSAVPVQRFMAAAGLDFSARMTSWTSAPAPLHDAFTSAAEAAEDPSLAASNLEGMTDIPSLDAARPTLADDSLKIQSTPVEETDLHAPVHEMDSETGGNGLAFDVASGEVNSEFVPVEMDEVASMDADFATAGDAATKTSGPRHKTFARRESVPAVQLLDLETLENASTPSSGAAPSAALPSDAQSVGADSKPRALRRSEPALAPAPRSTAPALPAHDLAVAASAPAPREAPATQLQLPPPTFAALGATETAQTSAEPRTAALSWTPQIHHELAAKAREFFHRGEAEMRFTLDPPEMGKLRVHLEISEHRVSATITATNAATAALLERDRSDLVRAFQSQGIEDVSVHVGAERDAPREHPDSHTRPERESSFESEPYTDPARRAPRSSRSVVDCFV